MTCAQSLAKAPNCVSRAICPTGRLPSGVVRSMATGSEKPRNARTAHRTLTATTVELGWSSQRRCRRPLDRALARSPSPARSDRGFGQDLSAQVQALVADPSALAKLARQAPRQPAGDQEHPLPGLLAPETPPDLQSDGPAASTPPPGPRGRTGHQLARLGHAPFADKYPMGGPAQNRVASRRLDLDREIHPILVGLTESHDQRKGRLARRSAVDL
jgi:hypothetical protein